MCLMIWFQTKPYNLICKPFSDGNFWHQKQVNFPFDPNSARDCEDEVELE